MTGTDPMAARALSLRITDAGRYRYAFLREDAVCSMSIAFSVFTNRPSAARSAASAHVWRSVVYPTVACVISLLIGWLLRVTDAGFIPAS